MKLIECIPNFSEGRYPEAINYIAESIKKVNGVKLLHIDVGYDANRTVMTFVGDADLSIIAAFNAIKAASEVIDMSKQNGTHPRIGATDVFPLVPVSGISMDEVINYSKLLANRVANELNIPIYLYEESSQNPNRKKLEDIRKGEYEGLEKKMNTLEWIPDFGAPIFNEKSGATVIGARNFLIAYNVNLKTKDVNLAKEIASQIRSRSHSVHRLEGLKAIGWFVDEYECCQVSTNVTDFRKTNVCEVYEKCKELATKHNIDVDGSEIIGLLPKEALDGVANFYSKNQNLSEKEGHQLAIQSLGLDRFKSFVIQDRIIEYLL